MTNPTNILIVDDHPFIIEAYKNAISKYAGEQFEFAITQAGDCKSGYDYIAGQYKRHFDIAFFDISCSDSIV